MRQANATDRFLEEYWTRQFYAATTNQNAEMLTQQAALHNIMIATGADMIHVAADGTITPVFTRTETAQERPASTETNVNEQGTEGDSGMNKLG